MKNDHKISVVEVCKQDKKILFNLMQLYQYDFAEIEGNDCNSKGLFEYNYLNSYWEEDTRHPFLIKYKNKIAGLALVNRFSELGQINIHSIAEFFILRNYRQQGIGLLASVEIIKKFSGQWEISQTYKNHVAQVFWLKVVRHLVGNDFKQTDLAGKEKIVLSF